MHYEYVWTYGFVHRIVVCYHIQQPYTIIVEN